MRPNNPTDYAPTVKLAGQLDRKPTKFARYQNEAIRRIAQVPKRWFVVVEPLAEAAAAAACDAGIRDDAGGAAETRAGRSTRGP